MLSLLLLSFSLLSILLFYSSQSSGLRKNGKPLPRPPNTLPIIGNGILFLQDRHKLFSWFTKCTQIFGLETFEISVPSLPPGVVINDPKNLEFIFKNEGIFEKGDFFKKRSWDLFGNGIINSDGHNWKVQRKAGLHFMSNSNLRVLTDVVLPKYLEELVTVLDAAVLSGEIVDLEVVFLELTTQLMGRMAYDMEMHSSDPFSVAFEFASGKIGERFQNPLWQVTESFFGQPFQNCITTVKEFGREIVATAVQSRNAQAAVREYMKMNSFMENEVEVSDEESDIVEGSLISSFLESLDDHQLVADAALNYLSAGRDTTAQSLTWTFYLLMKHGNVLPSLRTEIEALKLGANESKKNVATYTPNSLPMTMATIYESLRLYPPVPFELKQCMKPDGITLPDGTFLPFQAIVVWCPWAMSRSSDIWKPPSTLSHSLRAEDFEPMRWLKQSEKTASVKFVPKSAHEFPVFNGGTRTCLGKKMAEAVMCQVVACLVERYEFKMEDDGMEKVSRNSLTLPMKGGLRVYVARRDEMR